jgi:hypothetical protein
MQLVMLELKTAVYLAFLEPCILLATVILITKTMAIILLFDIQFDTLIVSCAA